MTIKDKITALREEMRKKKLDAYILPSSDPHQSEYVAPHWESRLWLSGFTGSAAIMVITHDHAGLWTDSRYFIQAEDQLSGTPVTLHRQTPARGPEHIDWMCENLPERSKVGIDGMLFSLNQNRTIAKKLHAHDIDLETGHDLISDIWKDRPGIPTEAIFELSTTYTGLSRTEKFKIIRAQMQSVHADYYLVSALDEIAWAFNLRGRDIAFNPVFVAYAVIGQSDIYLFVDSSKISDDLKSTLNNDGVHLKPYDSIPSFLHQLKEDESLLIDNATTSIGLYQAIPEDVAQPGNNIIQPLKAKKNPTEIKHLREVMRYDGVALTRLYRWLESELAADNPVTEAELSDQLAQFRAEQPGYYGESFPAIVGYQSNGAIVHYRPEHGKSATLKPEGVLLLDSGGQYLSGTTDITRTTALGEVTENQKRHNTLVLKGHINVATLHYPAGTKGYQIDTLARQALWKHHLNFGHGTGHGVGFFLNVHEGPQGISSSATRGGVPLEVGMYTSNEPGLYFEGEYGIRIENLVLTVPAGSSDFGEFLKFDTITLFPIDKKLIDRSLLSQDEIDWLNDYHQLVLKELSPLLNPAEVQWMKEMCAPID